MHFFTEAGGFASLSCSLLHSISLELAKQKLCWKLERREGANSSKPERIGYTQECGLLGSLFRSIDMAGKETGEVGGQEEECNSKKETRGLNRFELTHTLSTTAINKKKVTL